MPKKNLSLLQKEFTPTPSFLLSKSSVADNRKKKNLVWGFAHHTFAKKVRGFTFIETMVAISLLMTSVAFTVTVIRTNILVSSITKDAVVARFLAQEGIEYTRHVRDSHLVDFEKTDDLTIDWLGGLEACYDGTPCTIDTADPTLIDIISCPAGVCPVLKYNETENRYGYDSGVGWEDTVFMREIEIADPGTGTMNTEAIVTVRVVWSERDGSSREVIYQQNLFNWIQ